GADSRIEPRGERAVALGSRDRAEMVQRITVPRRPQYARVAAEVEPIPAQHRKRPVYLPAAEDSRCGAIIASPTFAFAEGQLIDICQAEVMAPVEIELLPVAPWIDVEAQTGVFLLIPERLPVSISRLDEEAVRES